VHDTNRRDNKSTSQLGFDVPNARLYFFGQMFQGLQYQISTNLSESDEGSNIKDLYFVWNTTKFTGAKTDVQFGKMTASVTPAKASSHVNRLSGPDFVNSLIPPGNTSARVKGIRPTVYLLGDQLIANFQLINNADAPRINRNSRNDFRYQVGIAFSPFGRFPLSPVAEWDHRNSPFNVNIGYGWAHGRQEYSFGSGATAQVSDQLINTDYHTFDVVLVNRGLLIWYGRDFRNAFESRNAVAALTGTTLGKLAPGRNWNGNAQAQRLTVSYPIPLANKMHLVPFYQFIELKVEDNRIRSFGAALAAGGRDGSTRPTNGESREHHVGLNWYLAGENLAIKSHYNFNDHPDAADTFQVIFQHQWRFSVR
jgi:hypothetical protein